MEIQPRGAELGEAFRADAKAEGNEVVIGGWECIGGRRPAEARWFSVSLTKATAPWAFSRGEPYRTIAALELFGTLLCILAFSDQWPRSAKGRAMIAGSTDNQGNAWVLSRLMSSKFPMLVVLGGIAVQLRARNLHLELDWVPRTKNEEADALTNHDFSAFSPDKRLNIDPENLGLIIMPELLDVAENLYKDIVARRSRKAEGPAGGTKKKAKLRETDPWQ